MNDYFESPKSKVIKMATPQSDNHHTPCLSIKNIKENLGNDIERLDRELMIFDARTTKAIERLENEISKLIYEISNRLPLWTVFIISFQTGLIGILGTMLVLYAKK